MYQLSSSRRRKRRSTGGSLSEHADVRPGHKPFYGDEHQGLLQSELEVGEALLRRHRASHGRTKYFQRVRMALAALKQSGILEIYPRLHKWTQSKMSGNRTRKEEHWCLENDRAIDAERKALLTWASSSSYELLSRLESCVEVLVAELSRGFFVPLNATLLALVARLWTLVRELRSQIQAITGTTSPNSKANIDLQPATTTTTGQTKLNYRAQEILHNLGIHTTCVEQLYQATRQSCENTERERCQNNNTQLDLREKDDDCNADSQKPPVASAEHHKLFPDDDVGESMDQLSASKTVKQKHPTGRPTESIVKCVDNDTLVKEWQRSQKQKKGKRKIENDNDGGETKRPKKKKKKQKRTTGDFFDELFG